MGILNIDLNNINLDVTYYNEVDHETIIHIRLLAWPIKFEKRKAFKKELNEELMLVSSIQIGGIRKFTHWVIFCPDVLKNFKHKIV